MPTDTDLSRISLRRDQVLEIHFDKLPAPPDAFLKLPGAREWWQALLLHDERRIQAFHRLVNNLQISANNTSMTPVP
jgi:hypothetical protein